MGASVERSWDRTRENFLPLGRVPPEVKAGELIIGGFPNVRCKGGHRTGIAAFQLGKRL